VTMPNERWAMDFMHDTFFDGRKLRVLTVIDVFTRECLALMALDHWAYWTGSGWSSAGPASQAIMPVMRPLTDWSDVSAYHTITF